MKRNSPFYIGFWQSVLWTLLVSLVLLAIVLPIEWHAIEEDVANNARQNLAAADINWASIETFNNGRTATITGTAPNEEEAQLTLKVVEHAKGVDKAEFDFSQIKIIPKSSAYLNAIVTRDSIVLRGTLPDQSAIDQLLSDASDVFGENKVVNKMSIGENVAPLANHQGLFQALMGKGNTAPFSASFIDDGLTLNGQVIDTDQKNLYSTQFRRIVNLEINNNLNVVLPPIKRNVCQELVNELLSKGKINFETGKSEIKQNSFPLLQDIANIAIRCPESNFEIAGHTDSTGNLNFNMELSQQRSQSVADHLTNLGLKVERFSAVGYGPNHPIADNNTEEGREQNRRIEFVLTSDDAEQEQKSTN